MPGPRDSGLTPTDPTPLRTAVPGIRDEMSSDAKITSRITRHVEEPTPPPLPPSPAAADAAQWLAKARKKADTGAIAPAPTASSADRTVPVSHGGAPAWVFPVLLAITALVIGMILGALLFGRR